MSGLILPIGTSSVVIEAWSFAGGGRRIKMKPSMEPQEKFGWFIGSKAGRDLGVKDSGGCESEGAAPGVVQQDRSARSCSVPLALWC